MSLKKIIVSASLVSLIPIPSLAAGLDILGDITRTGQTLYGNEAQPIDPKFIIFNLAQIVLGFLGFILIILLLYAGFRWMTSDGNEKTIEGAKSTIRSAIIGLIIVMTAYSIAAFITTAIQQAV